MESTKYANERIPQHPAYHLAFLHVETRIVDKGVCQKQAFDGRAEERGIQDKRTVFNRCDRAVINSRKKKEPADAGSFAL
jgi:hypothetical protein